MNSSTDNSIMNLNDCGCCTGIAVATPIEVFNRPGLNTISYRIGDYADFKASMLARLSANDFPALTDFRTHNDNDFSIALLDAWAMVADVLTFYDQTIANENYLNTATERLSIFELASLIGYKPHPGVAASSLLAFTMDDLPGSPEKIILDIATKVQSTPKQDELAQLFETVEEIEARPAWNAIRPQLSKPQIPVSSTNQLVFDGISTGIQKGDGILFSPVGEGNVFAIISSVQFDQENDLTHIEVNKLSTSSIHQTISTINLIAVALPPPAGEYLGETLSAADLAAEAETQGFDIEEIFDALSVNNPAGHAAIVFHQVAPVFAHNAPAWESLPESLKGDVPVFETSGDAVVIDKYIAGPYKYDQNYWPGGDFSTLDKLNQKQCPKGAAPFIFSNPGTPNTTVNQPEFNLAPFDFDVAPFLPTAVSVDISSDFFVENNSDDSTAWLFLDNKYKGISNQTPVILNDENKWGIYSIEAINETTKSCFTVTAKVTRLSLDSDEKFKEFTIRGTSVYFQSERLPLAQIKVDETIPQNNSQTLALNGFVNGLYEGQRVVLSGIEENGSGKLINEFLTLTKVEHQLILGGSTHITFTPALNHIYLRESVTINANVAPATHGETVQEVLGSGDATQSYQRFVLKQPPLTHVSAATPSGVISSLQVRVNDVLWHEVGTLLDMGPSDRVFVTHGNDAGETIIQFGNGKSGARLPTGQDNIQASYRKGIGIQGLVDAKQLNILMSRPLGLKEVLNPKASTGGDDPESHDDAQTNAPLTVLTLDRAVSLKDYEDFSRAFGGIAKASAISVSGGQKSKVVITVAGPTGAEIQQDSDTYINLLQALTAAGDPLAQFCLQSYRSETFRIAAKVKVDTDFIADKVLFEVETALRASFKFEVRNFAQTVALSEVIAVIQNVPGVLAVDVDYLYRGNIQTRESRIPAAQSRVNSRGLLVAAELLTLHPGPLDYLELMS